MRATTTVMSSACSGVPAHCSAAETRLSTNRRRELFFSVAGLRLSGDHAEFFAVDIFDFGEAVTIGDEDAAGRDFQRRSACIGNFLEKADHCAAHSSDRFRCRRQIRERDARHWCR